MNPRTQLDTFRAAVIELGGQVAASRKMGVKERTLKAWYVGDRPLTANALQRVARALVTHSDRCRYLESQLCPAFTRNLTERQRTRLLPPWAVPAA